MAFKAGRFNGYKNIGDLANGQWVEDDIEMAMAGNAAWDYCASNRLNGAGLAKNCDAIDAMGRTWELDGNSLIKIFELPLSQVAYGVNGLVRVHVLLERDSDSYDTFVISYVTGADFGYSYKQLSAASSTKELVTLDVPFNHKPGSSLKHEHGVSVWLKSVSTGGGPSVTIHSISVFEPEPLPLRFRKFADTTDADNTIGVADWPISTASRTLLKRQQEAVHSHIAAKPNILNQCFVSGLVDPLTSDYGTDKDRLGRWIIRKQPDSTSFKVVTDYSIGGYDVTYIASLWSIASISYDNETSGFTAGDILEDTTSGARARILKVTDAGTTGSLDISYITGTFSNNDAIRGRSYVDGTVRGGALVNGSVGAGTELDSDTESLVYLSADSGYAFFDLDCVAPDAEYELRLDAKYTGVGTDPSIEVLWVSALFAVTPGDKPRIPRSSWHEQDDPIRANPYKYIKQIQNSTFEENIGLIMSDYRMGPSASMKAQGRPPDYMGIPVMPIFARGLLYKHPRSSKLHARVWVTRSDVTNRRVVEISSVAPGYDLPYDNYVIGDTSGAVALADYLVATGTIGDPDYFYYRRVSGDFLNGETVTGSAPGSFAATIDTDPQRIEGVPVLHFAVRYDSTWPVAPPPPYVASKTIDLSSLEHGKTKLIDIVLDIPTSQYDNTYDVIAAGDMPFVWEIQGYSSYGITGETDMPILEQYQVFQEPGTSLDAELYEDQTE